MDKKRLLYLITRSSVGGAQNNVLELIRGFIPEYEVHLGAGDSGPLTTAAQAYKCKVHIIPSLIRQIDPIRDLHAVGDLGELMRRVAPTVVHAHSSKAGAVGRIAAKLQNIPCVFTAHGWGFAKGVPIVRRKIAYLVEKVLGRVTSKIVCVSYADRALALQKGIARENDITVIHYGIPMEMNASPVEMSEKYDIIMIARFSEQKNQATLLEALSIIKAMGRFANAIFVGSGPLLPKCKKLALDLALHDRVVFTGDSTNVDNLLLNSRVFVLSTHYEGLPISILEAMRAGVPVVATEVNGVPEQVENGVTGFLVPRSDPQALANALLRLLNDSQLRKIMGEKARESFAEKFTSQTMIESLSTLYKSVSAAKLQ